MPGGRKPPVYAALVVRPCDLSPEALAADGGMTVKELAGFLRVCERTAKTLVADGTVPSAKVKGRRVVSLAGARAFLASRFAAEKV